MTRDVIYYSITTSSCESERTWLLSADAVDKTSTYRGLGHSVITLASEVGPASRPDFLHDRVNYPGAPGSHLIHEVVAR